MALFVGLLSGAVTFTQVISPSGLLMVQPAGIELNGSENGRAMFPGTVTWTVAALFEVFPSAVPLVCNTWNETTTPVEGTNELNDKIVNWSGPRLSEENDFDSSRLPFNLISSCAEEMVFVP